MKLKFLIALIFAALALAGCATTQMQPGSAEVKFLANAELVKTCRFVERASFTTSNLPLDQNREEVEAKIKNRAAAIGGTHVLTTGAVITMPGPVAVITGDIYRCTA